MIDPWFSPVPGSSAALDRGLGLAVAATAICDVALLRERLGHDSCIWRHAGEIAGPVRQG